MQGERHSDVSMRKLSGRPPEKERFDVNFQRKTEENTWEIQNKPNQTVLPSVSLQENVSRSAWTENGTLPSRENCLFEGVQDKGIANMSAPLSISESVISSSTISSQSFVTPPAKARGEDICEYAQSEVADEISSPVELSGSSKIAKRILQDNLHNSSNRYSAQSLVHCSNASHLEPLDTFLNSANSQRSLNSTISSQIPSGAKSLSSNMDSYCLQNVTTTTTSYTNASISAEEKQLEGQVPWQLMQQATCEVASKCSEDTDVQQKERPNVRFISSRQYCDFKNAETSSDKFCSLPFSEQSNFSSTGDVCKLSLGKNIPEMSSYNICEKDSVFYKHSDDVLSNMSFDSLLGATGGSDIVLDSEQNKNENSNGKMIKARAQVRLGLLGGGGDSSNNGSSGWGTPPTTGASGWNSGAGNNGGQWSGVTRHNGSGTLEGSNNGAGQGASKPPNTWAQAAGKGLNNHNGASGNTSACNEGEQNMHNSIPKIRLEDLTQLQLAAVLSDGWGKANVNQDRPWDVPLSPHSNNNESSNSLWRAPANIGTEIWDTTIRQRNKGPPPNTSINNNQPWGHTPSTHIGVPWNEEETSNMWTGVPQSNSNTWPTEPPPSTSMWQSNNSTELKTWGNHGNTTSASWRESDETISDNSVWPPGNNKPPPPPPNYGSWSQITSKKEPQPSGWDESSPPVGRRPVGNFDDGTSVWGNPMRQGKVSHWKEMPPTKPSGGNSVGVMPPQQLSGNVPVIPPPGPGMIRLPTPSGKGDTWGKPPSLNRGMSWTDMPPQRASPGPGNWEDALSSPQTKSVPATPNTPASAFGSWGEPTSLALYWGAKPKNPSASTWGDGHVDTSSWGGPTKQSGKPLTKDLIWASKQFRLLTEMNFKKEDVENALRHNNMDLEDSLVELQSISGREASGLDVEGFNAMGGNRPKMRPNSLTDDLNFVDQSLDPSFQSNNYYNPTGFQSPHMMPSGYVNAQNFKHQGSNVNSSGTPNLLNNAAIGGQASSLNTVNNLNHAVMQKLLQQTQPFNANTLPQNSLGSHGGRMGQQNFPSTAQLRHLVHQIQMAVHAGHLNPQILNQPLAPQTLHLLYQLLQQIKILHQLQQQQVLQSQHLSKTGGTQPVTPSPLQLNVQITQTKQRIMNLQNQIAAQQALYLKQQQQLQSPVQHTSLHSSQPSSSEVFKPNMDPVSGLHTDLRDLSLKETAQNHSRLNQWKLPSFEKDENAPTNSSITGSTNNNSSEFSRAPGSIAKSSSSNNLPSTHSTGNLQPLSDNTWSSLPRTQSDSWPDTSTAVGNCNSAVNNSGNSTSAISAATITTTTTVTSNSEETNSGVLSASESKDCTSSSPPVSASSSQSNYTLNDLVPEFEPGKPWKGTQMKSMEDDPHVTPGSVAKSPLSLNNIKDSDLLSWGTKSSTSSNDNLISSLASLSSSTWAFNPQSSSPSSSTNQQNSSTAGNAKSGNAKGGWGPLISEPGQDPWGSTVSKTRGPPPGLSGHNKNTGGSWTSGDASHHGWALTSSWDRQNSSNFLVLRNLTPQIDGSTLKTLCVQHGPLQLFHLFLNHGIALVRYSTREETAKAQSALNNCVLGNTTILADIPTEAEVQQYLQLASGQLAANSMGWPPQQQGNNPPAPTFHGSNSGGSSYQMNNSGNTNSKIDSATWNGTSLNLPGSHLWAFPGSGNNNANNLWGIQSSVGDHEQCTSSSINSFLPNDLLGGESV